MEIMPFIFCCKGHNTQMCLPLSTEFTKGCGDGVHFMDEATSALDNESEFIVSQSLERLAQGRTTVTIAHRLTTIQNADRILVLSEGQIAEEGCHRELLEKKGIYYQLYMSVQENGKQGTLEGATI